MTFRIFSPVGALATALLFSSCATVAAKNSPKTGALDDLPTRVIDAHMHVHFTGKVGDLGFSDTAAEYARQLKSVNGVGSVAHTTPGRVTEERLDFRALSITPCLGLSKNPDPVVAERAIREGGFRCFKVYLGYEAQYASHPKYKAIYRIAQKYKVPVVFHTGDTNDIDGILKYADPLTIDEVAVEFRSVKFVIAHIGNPWIQSAAEVAYKNPNVYLDASALLIGDLSRFSPEAIEKYVVEPVRWVWGYLEDPKKLMFGTDYPLVRVPEYLNAIKRGVPREHWDRFFYQNAVDVFGIVPRAIGPSGDPHHR